MALNLNIEQEFEATKNKKAFFYTTGICVILLLLFIFITWHVLPPSEPVVQDLIEVNLGNNEDGFGEEQPLIKGERSEESAPQPKQSAPKEAVAEKVETDDNAQEDAAPVAKVEKKVPKVKTETAVTPTPPAPPKPAKPKITMPGGTAKTGGNNPTEDNGYRYQGNTPGGKGDAGDPNGNKDSYGNNPGGKIGGPKVIGNRKIIKYYSFTGDLPKATINALVKVSPSGQGRFLGFGKGSTTRDSRYEAAITRYLSNISFDKSDNESTVTVVFNFSEN
ncbi:MAG: hypothetical protein JST02_01490 [Bacteroidetes bacterium]|nr:hypothetical protein [Bacteroidota bacterium]